MASVREQVSEAAITLLGTEGLRALTHARVDAKAEVPKGSASNYFRTRAALLEGAVDWMLQREVPLVAGAYSPETPDELARTLFDLFEEMTGPGRVLTSARLVLVMEASHNPEVRNALARARSTTEKIVIPAVERMGASDPELAMLTISAAFEGLFLQRLARGAEFDARPVLDRLVHAVVG
ncbi:TetR/AcrR family transcriptional regulator [Nocardioides caldifontis]|uniref:TetR/AcrR family transcriptional regulator n=1 Tax=Nocardioides caldifontis TaxID=2588938 RepID=UPI0011E0056B|nr:TetR family transcriptional regulator [Nocardioides caldifontis]